MGAAGGSWGGFPRRESRLCACSRMVDNAYLAHRLSSATLHKHTLTTALRLRTHTDGVIGREADGALRGAVFGSDGPAVGTEVQKAGRIVLPSGRGDVEVGAKDEVLLVVPEVLQVHGRSTVEVDGEPDAYVVEAVNRTLDRLASEDGVAGEPAIGDHHVDFGGPTPKIENVAVAEQGARGGEVRIGEGKRGISWEATLRVSIAEAEEVHADRCVGIGARLDILRACSGRGGEKQ